MSLIEFCGEIKHETKPGIPDEGSYLVYDGANEVWLPKKLIASARHISGSDWEFEIPEWLAEREGII
ncbi:hypothetical protein KAR91_80725 [Candidatus Pacearchaeota archaeon]|nr:hypothetical protein [Candidatus Pacearchaeota archaeon]